MRNHLLLVAVAAIGCAAFRFGYELPFCLLILSGALLGAPRREWIGASLFGFVYLAYSWYCPQLPSTLREPVPMPFGQATALIEVIEHVREHGYQVFLDSDAFAHADCTIYSPVLIEMEGVPLRTSLSLALGQLGLTYYLDPGGVIVVSDTSPYLLPIHCAVALLASLLGASVGRYLEIHYVASNARRHRHHLRRSRGLDRGNSGHLAMGRRLAPHPLRDAAPDHGMQGDRP